MRGKNKLWLSLIVLLFGAMMMDVAIAQTPCDCRIYVAPAEVHNEDMGLTGFTVDVNVENVCDLYGFGFKLDYAPYVSILAGVSVTEGPFLKQGGMTVFTKKIKHFEGEVLVGCSLLYSVPGVSGNGTLATIEFSVVECGSSALDLTDVQLLDSSLAVIPCEVVSGSYIGPMADMRGARRGSPIAYVGDIDTFDSKVTNLGQVPLNVRVKYDFVRGDGKTATFWAGQSYRSSAPPPVYLYVNEFIPYFTMWPTYGDEPWLDAPDDGNYIETAEHCTIMGLFGFEDLVLGDRTISKVVLEGYTNGPYDEGTDYDVYAVLDLETLDPFSWLGSLYGKGEPAWVGVRWTTDTVSDVVPETLTEEGLSGLYVLIHAYGGAGPGNFIDCLRLRVEFSPVSPLVPPTYVIPPGKTQWVGTAKWELTEDDVGFYSGTATCYYTYNGFTWIAGATERAQWLLVRPPKK